MCKILPKTGLPKNKEAYTTEKSRLESVFLLTDGTKIAAQKVKTGEWHLETGSSRPVPDEAFLMKFKCSAKKINIFI